MCNSCLTAFQHIDFKNVTQRSDYLSVEPILGKDQTPQYCGEGTLLTTSCGKNKTIDSYESFYSWYDYFIYFIFRFHTVDGINRECKVSMLNGEDGTFEITNEMLENATLQCPVGSLFDWSPHEYSVNRKLWWTAVIEETIQISIDQVLTITYVLKFLFYILIPFY